MNELFRFAFCCFSSARIEFQHLFCYVCQFLKHIDSFHLLLQLLYIQLPELKFISCCNLILSFYQNTVCGTLQKKLRKIEIFPLIKNASHTIHIIIIIKSENYFRLQQSAFLKQILLASNILK